MKHLKKQLVLATSNQHKSDELCRLFDGASWNLLTLDNFPEFPEVIEDGETFEANAIKKARAVSLHTKILTLADDSGLKVDALNGQPGIYSRRYSGENATYRSNINKLLHRLQAVPLEKRTASFVCCIALMKEETIVSVVQEECKGLILEETRGTNGFAYDNIFFYPPLNKTFGEMSPEEKNRVSHRAKALRKILDILNNFDVMLLNDRQKK